MADQAQQLREENERLRDDNERLRVDNERIKAIADKAEGKAVLWHPRGPAVAAKIQAAMLRLDAAKANHRTAVARAHMAWEQAGHFREAHAAAVKEIERL